MSLTIRSLLRHKGREVYTIQSNQSVYEAILEMNVKSVGALIVKEGDQMVGIVTERDYLRKIIIKDRSSKETAVDLIMSRELVVINPDHTIQEAMAVMTTKKCSHLPVIENGDLEGIVSQGDLIHTIIKDHEFTIEQLEGYMYGPAVPRKRAK